MIRGEQPIMPIRHDRYRAATFREGPEVRRGIDAVREPADNGPAAPGRFARQEVGDVPCCLGRRRGPDDGDGTIVNRPGALNVERGHRVGPGALKGGRHAGIVAMDFANRKR